MIPSPSGGGRGLGPLKDIDTAVIIFFGVLLLGWIIQSIDRRKEGEIETLLAYQLSLSPAKLRAVAIPWLRELRNLKLKPAKGRLKDLKKIDALLNELLNQVIEADAAASGGKSSVEKIEGKPIAARKSRRKGSSHDRA